ncbi:MAG TPA: twin-arginine translocase TatA/TatE family subunit [Candidatus Omnitrophota bacterium]|nr:twin-arginine translocase TatA/TatE family subunit [Candidatus Omnitrophota bacterium]
MGRIGIPELLIILVILLLFFGGSKIKDLAKGLGESIKEFKKGMNEKDDQQKGAPKA